MNKKSKDIEQKLPTPNNGILFDRVVSILEQARTKVVQTVNSQMIIAYWLIGREILCRLSRMAKSGLNMAGKSSKIYPPC